MAKNMFYSTVLSHVVVAGHLIGQLTFVFCYIPYGQQALV